MAVFFTRRGNPPSIGKQLSDYTEGDIVQIPENGVPVEFYVAKHDYESDLNGTGGTLVVRVEPYKSSVWSNSGSNALVGSVPDSLLNSEYKEMLDENVRNLIQKTKIKYSIMYSGVSVIEREIFMLSMTELGFSFSGINMEGEELPCASLIKTTGYGNVSNHWSRSLDTRSSQRVWRTMYNNFNADPLYYSNGIRPIFVLPSTTKFDPDTNIIIG